MREAILSRAASPTAAEKGRPGTGGGDPLVPMMPREPVHGVVLFDGSCAFCERAVTFIAARDAAGYFRFGASQSPVAQALLARFGETRASTRSIILIEHGQLFRKSTAVLRIARRLPPPWAWVAALLFVPRPLRDAVYAVVAALRHRLAGRAASCALPPAAIRERLI